VIEFHDCDIHLKEIESFIKHSCLDLVHIHANNYAPIRKDDNLPLVLELTFSKHASYSKDFRLPHKLDRPNNRNAPDYQLIFMN